MSLSKKKEKMTVEKRKGIDLLSEVALTEEAQYEEVCKKSLRDFHKTRPSSSGTATKTAPSTAKVKPSVTNEGTGVKPVVLDLTKEESTKNKDSGDDNTQFDNEKGSDSEHETDENESGSESDQEENKEEIGDDGEEGEDEFVKTLSNDSDDEDEVKITDKVEGDEDEEMDYTTSQQYDDVDIRLNKPVQADDETVQNEGTDAEMINVQRGNENLKISQVIEDAHVTLSFVPQKTEVPITSSSHSSDLAAKFLNFADIPTIEAKFFSLMDVHVYHEVPSGQTPTLLTVPISVITKSSLVYTTNIPHSLQSFTPPSLLSTPTPPPTTKATNPQSSLPDFGILDEHLDERLGATRDEFMSYLSGSITARITEQVKNQLPQILPKKVSNFAPPVIQSMVTKSLEQAVIAKESSQPQSSYEAAASLT
ncbi:hypothetical protein Tco_1033395 [Tanacetum coccineum]